MNLCDRKGFTRLGRRGCPRIKIKKIATAEVGDLPHRHWGREAASLSFSSPPMT